MSREFGEYNGGFFHDRIRQCAEDCDGGRFKITREWAKFLEEFYNLSYAISSAEASDWCYDTYVQESRRILPILRREFDHISKVIECDHCVDEDEN